MGTKGEMGYRIKRDKGEVKFSLSYILLGDTGLRGSVGETGLPGVKGMNGDVDDAVINNLK